MPSLSDHSVPSGESPPPLAAQSKRGDVVPVGVRVLLAVCDGVRLALAVPVAGAVPLAVCDGDGCVTVPMRRT